VAPAQVPEELAAFEADTDPRRILEAPLPKAGPFTRPRVLLALILGAGLALRLWGIAFSSSAPLGRPDEEIFSVEAMAMFARPCNRLATGWPDGFFMIWHAVLRMERAYFNFRYGAGSTSLACLLAVRPLAVLLPMRILSALLGTVTAWVVGRLAAALAVERACPAALWATALYAVNYLVGRDAHFGVSDAVLCLEIALTLLGCVKAMSRGPWWLVAAAFCAGLAFSTKYSAAGLAVPCVLAGGFALARFRGRAAAPVACAVVAAAVGVWLFSPHILTHWHELRAGLSRHALRYEAAHSTPIGLVYYPTTVFPAAFGWPGWILCLAALAFHARRRDHAPLTGYLLVFFVVFLGPLAQVFVRYGSPLVPALAAVGGIAAAGLCERLSERAPHAVVVPALALLLLAAPAAHLVAFDRVLARADTRDLARTWLVDRGADKVVLTDGAYARVQAIDPGLSAVCRRDLPEELWRATPTLPPPLGPGPDHPIEPEPFFKKRWRGSGIFGRPVRAGLGEPGWEQIAFHGAVRNLYWESDRRWGPSALAAPGGPDYLVEARGPRAIGILVGVGPSDPPAPRCWAPAAHFSPGALDAAEWDRCDAFLVPFMRLAAVQRPGPEISIYQNVCRGR
jgi:Dolichyl-phosphate-mannose-protein mannosyltransferase